MPDYDRHDVFEVSLKITLVSLGHTGNFLKGLKASRQAAAFSTHPFTNRPPLGSFGADFTDDCVMVLTPPFL
jgi:hypothetical protein